MDAGKFSADPASADEPDYGIQIALLAAIVASSDDAIVSKTVDGIVIGWNHGAERLYGYTAEEMMGEPVAILFPPDHYQEYQRVMSEVRQGKAVPAFDTVRRRKDGTLINISVGFTPIEARDGEIIGTLKHSHDITRIKKLEAQFIEAQKMEVVESGLIPEGLPATPVVLPAETPGEREEAERLRPAIAHYKASPGPVIPHRRFGPLSENRITF